MVIQQIEISKIKPYSKNAKKHDKKQIQLVAQSIKRFGWAQPVVVDNDLNLIIGHCRVLAAKTLNLETVPTIKMDNLTEEEVIALRLADNKLNGSAWDMALVREDLKLIDTELIDITGFNSDLILEQDGKDDDVPELSTEPKSKTGEVYLLGNHRVMCGDSTSEKDVITLMNGVKGDLVVTDPPYNVNYEGGTGLKIKNDDMDDEQFYLFLLSAFKRISENLKLGGSFYIWHADSEGFNFRRACKDAGLLVRRRICYGLELDPKYVDVIIKRWEDYTGQKAVKLE